MSDMITEKRKSTQGNKKKDKKKGTDNKLISIRIPKGMIEKLKRVADDRGDQGYQQVIKSYLAEALTSQDASETGSQKKSNPGAKGTADSSVVTEEMEPIGAPAIKKQSLHEHDIIHEDIRNLAKNLKPYYSYFAGKRFLITGAFGFLGKYMVHLLKYLNDEILDEKVSALLLDNFVTGYEQQVVLDKHLRFCRHNVIQPFETDQNIDYILHMAGIASPVYYTQYPIETMDVGTIGTRNMLELAVKKGVQSFMFASSSEVYGDPDPKHVPTVEEYHGNVSVNGPRACYDESKRYGETMCTAFWRVFNVPVKIIRPFNVYGPGIRPDDYRVLPNFIEHALRKEPLPIHGEGLNTRSFCYITDAIEAIFRVIFSDANGEPFNIGNPSPEVSVKELAECVAKVMPFKINIVHIDPPHAVYAHSDPKRRCPDIHKLQKVTGFKPRYGLEEGLRRTIEWFSRRL